VVGVGERAYVEDVLGLTKLSYGKKCCVSFVLRASAYADIVYAQSPLILTLLPEDI
jgi:hypothetical protein